MRNQETTLTETSVEETLSITQLATILSAELQLQSGQVARTIALLDEGNTIPFVARYRKEVTGSLDEVQIQAIADRAGSLRALHERKADVRRLIDAQGRLTPELTAAILAASTLQEVEDLYLPYRPKRKTRASVAREKGLAALAELILQQPELKGDVDTILEEHAQPFLDAEKGVETSLEAFAGARDIVAEIISEDANVRGNVRASFFKASSITAKVVDSEKIAEKDPNGVYQLYYEFSESVTKLVPHRVLALNRAEHEEVLRVSVSLPFEQAQADIIRHYQVKATSPFAGQLAEAMEDGYKRLLAPAMEREVRVELTRQAEEHAINIFAANLRNLLLQPPLRGRKVLGIDPGFRTGCKLTVVDETGKYIESDTLYLHQSEKAQQQLRALLARPNIDVIAIGNGTASRETEQLVASLIRELEQETGKPDKTIGYVIVNEAGASVYSASEAARNEFPALDATQRGTISIARRLQDPLAELLKIDPQAVGVGLYQHDVDQKELANMLERGVVSCVNFSGVEVNSASAALLKHVSGINARVANAIVKYREEHGPFKTRDELQKVSGLGPATFVQAAGFLKIANGSELLDNTFIHPESYAAARTLLCMLPAGGDDKGKVARLAERAAQFRQFIKLQNSLGPGNRSRNADGEQSTWTGIAKKVGVGLPTLNDIQENLEKPGLDPREALPAPLLRHDVLKMEDLQAGMLLQGTVRNVVDFGAFVDIGVKQDGLVHISELADRYVRDPLSVVAVGQVVQVRVLRVDMQRGRVQLSMKDIDK